MHACDSLCRAEQLVCALGCDAQFHTTALSEAKDAADAARESTFPFLERMEVNYDAAYAAASLLWAAALCTEAAHASTPALAAEARAGALRALDLAMLRGSVSSWARLAEPLVRAASTAASEAAAGLEGATTLQARPARAATETEAGRQLQGVEEVGASGGQMTRASKLLRSDEEACEGEGSCEGEAAARRLEATCAHFVPYGGALQLPESLTPTPTPALTLTLS